MTPALQQAINSAMRILIDYYRAGHVNDLLACMDHVESLVSESEGSGTSTTVFSEEVTAQDWIEACAEIERLRAGLRRIDAAAECAAHLFMVDDDSERWGKACQDVIDLVAAEAQALEAREANESQS